VTEHHGKTQPEIHPDPKRRGKILSLVSAYFRGDLHPILPDLLLAV